MLKIIEAEMRVAMALTGVTRIDQINRDILVAGGAVRPAIEAA